MIYSFVFKITKIVTTFFAEFVEVWESYRVNVQSHFVLDHSYSVLIVVSVLIVRISESKLDPYCEWVYHVGIRHTVVHRKNIFHHLMDQVCLYKLKYPVLKFMWLIPYRGGNKHLTHRIPVNTDILNLFKLQNSTWVPIFSKNFKLFTNKKWLTLEISAFALHRFSCPFWCAQLWIQKKKATDRRNNRPQISHECS